MKFDIWPDLTRTQAVTTFRVTKLTMVDDWRVFDLLARAPSIHTIDISVENPQIWEDLVNFGCARTASTVPFYGKEEVNIETFKRSTVLSRPIAERRTPITVTTALENQTFMCWFCEDFLKMTVQWEWR